MQCNFLKIKLMILELLSLMKSVDNLFFNFAMCNGGEGE